MLSYIIAWVVYVGAVLGLLAVYRRSLALYVSQDLRPIIWVLFASIMLTPWPIDSDTWLPAPAIVAALFHVLSGFGIAALKSLFPILVVSTVACTSAWWLSRKSS